MEYDEIKYEVYWEDEDGNTFYLGCKTKEEVLSAINKNHLKYNGTRILSTENGQMLSLEYFQ